MGGKPLYSVSPSSFLSLIVVSYHKETTVVILWGMFCIHFCKLVDKNNDNSDSFVHTLENWHIFGW